MRIMNQTLAIDNNLTVGRAQNVESKRHEQTTSITNRQGGKVFINKNYKIHRDHLKLIEPTMKILPPSNPPLNPGKRQHNIKYSKKKWQEMLDKLQIIFKDLKPDPTLNHLIKKVKQKKKTIPDRQKLKELKDQNKQRIGRLIKVKPSYPIDDLEKAFKKHTQLVDQISHNARRISKINTLALKRLKRCKSVGGTAREVNKVDQNQVQQAIENIPTSSSTRRPQSSIALKRRNLELGSPEENTNTIHFARLR